MTDSAISIKDQTAHLRTNGFWIGKTYSDTFVRNLYDLAARNLITPEQWNTYGDASKSWDKQSRAILTIAKMADPAKATDTGEKAAVLKINGYWIDGKAVGEGVVDNLYDLHTNGKITSDEWNKLGAATLPWDKQSASITSRLDRPVETPARAPLPPAPPTPEPAPDTVTDTAEPAPAVTGSEPAPIPAEPEPTPPPVVEAPVEEAAVPETAEESAPPAPPATEPAPAAPTPAREPVPAPAEPTPPATPAVEELPAEEKQKQIGELLELREAVKNSSFASEYKRKTQFLPHKPTSHTEVDNMKKTKIREIDEQIRALDPGSVPRDRIWWNPATWDMFNN